MPFLRPLPGACAGVLVTLLFCVSACVGTPKFDDPGDDDAGPGNIDASVEPQPDADMSQPDAEVSPPDAYVPPPDADPLADMTIPDAPPVVIPDAAPPPDAPPAVEYPPQPYGTSESSVIENLSWYGYVDSDADPDNNPFNEPVKLISLSDYYKVHDPKARVIIVNASAGWCSGCQEEAPYLVEFDAEFRAYGARFITALFHDSYYNPASTDFAKAWGEYYGSTFATVADPTDKLAPYYEDNTVPMNMAIDPSDMTIIDIHHGFDYDYMRQILETYCQP
jgi:hypothetical protein